MLLSGAISSIVFGPNAPFLGLTIVRIASISPLSDKGRHAADCQVATGSSARSSTASFRSGSNTGGVCGSGARTA